MANEERTILLSIELDTAHLEKAAKAASEKLFDLRGESAKAAVQHGKESVEYKKIQVEIQKYTKELNTTTKAISVAEQKQAQNTGSLREMRQALADAKVQYQEFTAEQRESAKGKEFVNAMLELKTSINEIEQSFGTFTGTVGNYEAAQAPLRKQLREVVQEMQKMHAAGQENSAEFKELSERAGSLRDSMDAVNEQVKTLATGTKLEANLNVMKEGFDGVIGGASAAEGALQLFGSENEDVARGIQKMVALQSISNGVNEVYNSLKKEGALVTALFNLRTKAQAATMAVSNRLFAEGSVAAKGFSKALLATGIGALIVGLGALIANFDKIKAALSGTSERQAILNETLEDYKAGATEAIVQTSKVEASFKLAEKGVISKEEALLIYNETLGASFGEMTNLNDAEATFIKKKEAFIKAAAERALATALFTKAAEEQVAAITANSESQIGIVDASTVNYLRFMGKKAEADRLEASYQKKGVENAKKTGLAKAQMIMKEAIEHLELAEVTEKANGLTSESETNLDNDRKKRAGDQKKRQEDAAKVALELSKRLQELSSLEIEMSLSDERKILEAHYSFLETMAEGNAAQKIEVETQKNADLRELELKELEQSKANIELKYAEEIKAAQNNAELLAALTEAKNAEIESLELEATNKFVQREAETIARGKATNAEQVKNERATLEEVKIIVAELALEKVKGTEAEFDAWKALQEERIAQLQRYRDAELAIEGKTSGEKKKIDQQTELQIQQIKNESFEADKAAEEKSVDDKRQLALTGIQITQQVSDTLFQIASNRLQAEINLVTEKYNAEAALLQDQLDANIITQTQYNAQKSALDATFKAKEKKLKEEQFKKDKAAAIISATIAAATAVLNALATPPPTSFILAGVAAGIGAAQIGIIASQPEPKFAKGGQVKTGVFGGNLHSSGGTKGVFSDGTRVEVEKDEAFYILNRRATAAIANLSDHNVKHGGNSFARGGVLKFEGGGSFAAGRTAAITNRFNNQNDLLQIVQSLPRPVVAVEQIIDATNNQVGIESRANF